MGPSGAEVGGKVERRSSPAQRTPRKVRGGGPVEGWAGTRGFRSRRWARGRRPLRFGDDPAPVEERPTHRDPRATPARPALEGPASVESPFLWVREEAGCLLLSPLRHPSFLDTHGQALRRNPQAPLSQGSPSPCMRESGARGRVGSNGRTRTSRLPVVDRRVGGPGTGGFAPSDLARGLFSDLVPAGDDTSARCFHVSPRDRTGPAHTPLSPAFGFSRGSRGPLRRTPGASGSFREEISTVVV